VAIGAGITGVWSAGSSYNFGGGSWECEFLLEQGYEVHGIIWRTNIQYRLIDHMYEYPQRGSVVVSTLRRFDHGTMLRRILEEVKNGNL